MTLASLAATSGCTRASPATPSGSGRRRRAATTAARARPSGTTPGSPRLPQDLVLADPGPDLMFDDRVYKRGALTLHALRRAVGDDASSRCCAPGSTSTATASSPRPTSRSWCATRRRSTPSGCSGRGCASAPCRRWSPAAPTATTVPPLTWVTGSVAQPTVFTHVRGQPTDAEHDEHPRPEHPAPAHPGTTSRPLASSAVATAVNAPAGDSSTRTASCPTTAPVSGYHAL